MERELQQKRKESAEPDSSSRRRTDDKRRLSYKEKREMEELDKEISRLTQERQELEAALSSGQLKNDEIIAAGERIGAVISRLDEAEMRMLELMEIEG